MCEAVDNEVREIDRLEPVLIEITVRGDATVWPMLPSEPMPLTIPVGCDLAGLAQYLFFKSSELAKAAQANGLIGCVNGELCHPTQLLRQGDDVSLTLTPAMAAALATA